MLAFVEATKKEVKQEGRKKRRKEAREDDTCEEEIVR